MFETIQADTDSPYTIIPNVEETRYYTYRVQIRAKSGLGPAAYISLDIAAGAFGVQSTIRLDSTKDIIIVPKYGSSQTWDSATSFSEGDLVYYSGDTNYYISKVNNNLNNQPDTSPTQWEYNSGGLLNYSATDFEIRLYVENEVKPLNLSGGSSYVEPVDPATADSDSWWIDTVTVNSINLPAYTAEIGVVADVTDDYVQFPDITNFAAQGLSGSATIKALYKTTTGSIITATKTIQYVLSTQGADGIDGGTTVQLSAYYHSPTEEYDGNGDLIYPATPTGGTFNFDTNTLTPPSGTPIGGGAAVFWSTTPPQVTEGVVYVCQQLYEKTTNVQPENLGDWGTPVIYAMYGGTVANVTLYAKSVGIPTKPADDVLVYDFAVNELREAPAGSPAITSTNSYDTTASGTDVAASWYTAVPTGDLAGAELYVIQTTFSIPGRSGIDATSSWTDPATASAQGNSIYNGFLLTNVPKNGTPPVNGPADNLVAYNFDQEWYENTVAGSPGTQYTSFQEDGGSYIWYDPAVFVPQSQATVYVVRETFTTFGAIGTDETSEWTTPKVYVPKASDGKSSYFGTVYCILEAGEDPYAPGTQSGTTSGVFDFDIGEYTTLPTGKVPGETTPFTWLATMPDLLTGVHPITNAALQAPVVWASQSLATSDDPQGVDNTLTWTVPVRVAAKGSAGASTDIIYARWPKVPSDYNLAALATPAPSAVTPPPDTISQPTWYSDIENLQAAMIASGDSDYKEWPIYASTGNRADENSNWVWNTPIVLQGTEVAEFVVYSRQIPSVTSLPKPANSDFSFNFATGELIDNDINDYWAKDIPAGNNDIWMSSGTASGDPEETVPVTIWSTPRKTIISPDAANIVYAYKRLPAGTDPNAPTGGIYDFVNGVLTAGPTGGPGTINWEVTLPPETPNDPYDVLWICQVIPTRPNKDVDERTIEDNWSVPVVFGGKGDPGQSTDIVFAIYETQPAKPIDGPANPPTSSDSAIWKTDVENLNTSLAGRIWSSVGTRLNADADWVWQTPIAMEGEVGDTLAEVTVYKRLQTQPGTPTGGTYDLANALWVSYPTDGIEAQEWLPFVDTDSSDGPAWMSKAAVLGKGQESVSGWTTPTLVFKDGEDGLPGEHAKAQATITMFHTVNNSQDIGTTDITSTLYWDWAELRLETQNGSIWGGSFSDTSAVTPTGENGSVWQISATITQAVALEARTQILASKWSAPARISGPPGQPGDDAAFDPQPYSGIITIDRGNGGVASGPTPTELRDLGIGTNKYDADTNDYPFYCWGNSGTTEPGVYAIVNNNSESTGWRCTGTSNTSVTWQAQTIIDTDMIRADAIQADQLQISANNDATGARMYFNGGQNRIEIYDSSGLLRIKIGKL